MGKKYRKDRGAYSDGDSPGNSDPIIFDTTESRKIGIFKRIMDPSFAKNMVVSDLKPGAIADFDEESIGEVTTRFYKIWVSKLYLKSRTESAVAKTLFTDTSGTDLKSDTLTSTILKRNFAEVQASTAQDEVLLESVATKCMGNIVRFSGKRSETSSAETSLYQLCDVSQRRSGAEKESISSLACSDENFVESTTEPTFSTIERKPSLDFQNQGRYIAQQHALEDFSVLTSEIQILRNLPDTQTEVGQSESVKAQVQKHSAVYRDEIYLSNIQGEATVSPIQKELFSSKAHVSSLQYETRFYSEDSDEILESEIGRYGQKSETETFDLESQKRACSLGAQIGEGLQDDPNAARLSAKAHHSMASVEAGVSGIAAEDSHSVKQTEEYFSDSRNTEMSKAQSKPLEFHAEVFGSQTDPCKIKTWEASEALCHKETGQECSSSGIHAETPKAETDISESPMSECLSDKQTEISTVDDIPEVQNREFSPKIEQLKEHLNKICSEITEPEKSEVLNKEFAADVPPEGGHLETQMIKTFSESQKTEIGKTQKEQLAFESELLKAQTVSSKVQDEEELPEAETEIDKLATETEECSSEGKPEIPETHPDPSEFPMEEVVLGTKTEISTVRLRDGAETRTEGVLQEIKIREYTLEVQSEILNPESPETYSEENVSAVQTRDSKRESEPSETQNEYYNVESLSEAQKEEGHTLSSRKERSSDERDDGRFTESVESYSSVKPISQMDPTGHSFQAESERELPGKEFYNECSNTNEVPDESPVRSITETISHEIVSAGVETDLSSHATFPNSLGSVSDDQVSMSERSVPLCYSSDNSLTKMAENQSTQAHHLDGTGAQTTAYSAGDKICEFKPFVYVLNRGWINIRCSYCFKTVKHQKKGCVLCSFAYYCDRECQNKHRQIHAKACPYLRRAGSSKVPSSVIRLVAHTMWKLEDPASHEIYCSVGDKTYYYRDLIVHSDYVVSNLSESKAEGFLRNQHELFLGFVNDSSISFEDFSVLYGKIRKHMLIISDGDLDNVGIGMYFGMAAIKHSCFPNANLSFIETTAQVVASCDIEITDPHEATVGFFYSMEPRPVRQAKAKNRTGEICNCVLCQNDEFEKTINEVKEGAPSSSSIMTSVFNTIKTLEREQDDDQNDRLHLKMACEALTAVTPVTGKYHYARGKLLEFAATASMGLQLYREAALYYQQLLPFERFFFGLNNRFTVKTLLYLSRAYYEDGDQVKARDFLTQCLDVAYKVYTPEHPSFKRMRFDFIKMEERNWKIVADSDNFMY